MSPTRNPDWFDYLEPRSVYVVFEAFPRPKGASSHISGMVTALSENYAPVLLLCLGYGDMPAFQREGRVFVLRHKIYHPNVLKRAVEFGGFVERVVSGLRKPPELCVFRDPWGGKRALRSLPDSAAVFEVNGLPAWELPYAYPALSSRPGLLARIQDVEDSCLREADAVITVSDLTREVLIRRGVDPEKIRVVPNSADQAFFEASRNEADIRHPVTSRIFGYVGSLHPWQGVGLLLDAWALVAEEWPDVTMMIVHGGRSAAAKAIKARISRLGLGGRVVLHPPASPDALAALISGMEFTCAPLLETFRNTAQGCCPVKIVESMAAGTPVLASDLRVNRAIISHDYDGFLVRAGDARAWAVAIRALLEDPFRTRGLANAASRTAQERFTRTAMFDKLDRVFHWAVEAAAEASGNSLKPRQVEP